MSQESKEVDKEIPDQPDHEYSKTRSFKPHNNKEEPIKVVKEVNKFPGWKDGKNLEKSSYSDRFVQKLVKGSKQEDDAKRQPKVKLQFKPSEALLAEAAKVDQLLNKLIVRSEETERSTKFTSTKSNVDEKVDKSKEQEKLSAEKKDNVQEQPAKSGLNNHVIM